MRKPNEMLTYSEIHISSHPSTTQGGGGREPPHRRAPPPPPQNNRRGGNPRDAKARGPVVGHVRPPHAPVHLAAVHVGEQRAGLEELEVEDDVGYGDGQKQSDETEELKHTKETMVSCKHGTEVLKVHDNFSWSTYS